MLLLSLGASRCICQMMHFVTWTKWASIYIYIRDGSWWFIICNIIVQTADAHLHTTFRNGHIELSELKLLRLEKDDFTWRIGYYYNVYLLFLDPTSMITLHLGYTLADVENPEHAAHHPLSSPCWWNNFMEAKVSNVEGNIPSQKKQEMTEHSIPKAAI